MKQETQPHKLPAGWQEVELGEILESIPNGTTAAQNKDGKGYRVTRIETIAEAKIDLKRTAFVELDNKNFDKFKLKEGDILFSHINSTPHIGKTAIYTPDLGVLVHGMNLLRLSPKKEMVFPGYLLYLLKSKPILAYFQTRCKKSVNQSSLNSSFIKLLKIPLPPLPIQKKIVSILEKAEKLKQKRGEADKKTAEYLQSVFYEMFFKDKFEMKSLKDVCNEIQNGFAFGQFNEDNEGLIHIRPFNISEEGNLTFNQIKCIPQKELKSDKYLLGFGDVIINTTNSAELVGKTAIFNSNKKCSFSNHMTKLRIKKEIISSYYLWFILNHYWKSGTFKSLTKSWVNQVGIDSSLLKQIQIPLPPLPLQQKFAKIVEKVEKMKEKQKESKQKIDELFDVLMQKAFRGELVR